MYIFFRASRQNLGLDYFTIALSVGSALLNIVVMCYLIYRESKTNHLSFWSYALLSMQGKFGFTPFIEQIAQGNIQAVDYSVDATGTLYFTAESLRKLTAAMTNKKCKMKIIKMGHTCAGISNEEMYVLWQLYDLCAKKYVILEEERTSELVDRRGEYVMRLACMHGWDGVLRKMLHRQPPCDADDTDEDGLTCLMLACKFSHYTIVRQLLSRNDALRVGRDVPRIDLQDNNGWTALMYACDQEIVDLDLLRLLLVRVQKSDRFVAILLRLFW